MSRCRLGSWQGARRWGRIALVAYAAFLAVALLWPQPPTPAASLFYRWSRGLLPTGWLADVLRNVLLFMPVGFAAAGSGRGLRRALGLALAISVGAELAQVLIPGRFTSPLDVVANATGGVVGVLAWRHARSLWAADDRHARFLAWGASALAIGLVLLWPLVIRPAGTDADYYGSWTPVLGNFLHYEGEVRHATIGDVKIARGGPQPDSAAMRTAIADGAPWRVELEVGPRPASIAPIVAVHDARQKEIALVAADGDDLVLRVRTLGVALGFERAELRLRGGLGDWRAGETGTLEVEHEPGGVRVRVDGADPVVLRYPMARSWALWLPMRLIGVRASAVLDALWLAGLVFPAAFWARRRKTAWLGVAAILGALAAGPALSGMEGLTVVDGVALAGGIGLGCMLEGMRRRGAWGRAA